MIQTQGIVVDKETIAPAWWRLIIAVPNLTPLPLPGQFLLLRCGDDRHPCYLRRPVFPTHSAKDTLTLLLRPDPDPGYAWLLARQPGDQLDILGPLGVGFPENTSIRNLLLVSDGQTLGPLPALMDQAVRQGLSVTLAHGGSRASALYPASALPPIVEYQAATLDGSLGHRGLVTDLTPDLLLWADAVFAAGSMKLYQVLRTQMSQVRLRAEASYLYGLVTVGLMACGVGACLSCTIETETGLKLACLDGPVFDLTTITL